MNSNVGLLDRCIRFLVAANIFYFSYLGFIESTFNYLLLAFATYLTATSFTGYAVCYRILSIDTNHPLDKEQHLD